MKSGRVVETYSGILARFIALVGFFSIMLQASCGPALAEGGLDAIFGAGDFNLAVGGMAIVLPRYEGSKHYRAVGIPYVIPAGIDDGKGRITARGLDDIRFRAFDYQGFEFGPLAGWRVGRRENDADHLAGLGDIHGGVVVGGYAGYHIGWLMPFVSYHHQVTGDDTGGVLRFGVEGIKEVLPGLRLTGIAGASYAESTYMELFFGVTAAQSAASGLPVFNAGAGIKDLYLDLTADYQIDDHWSLKLGGRYARLLSDAANSPVIETRDQFQAMIGVSYKFSVPNPF